MTRRRWIADRWTPSEAFISGPRAAHLIRVLRSEAGTECDLAAGDRVFHAAIAEVGEDEVRFTLLSEIEAGQPLPITLLLSIFKFDRMEWVVEKATELGIERLMPVISRRSAKHLVQAAPARVERWRRIAREAAQQSRRSGEPRIEDVMRLTDAARAIAGSKAPLRLLLTEGEGAVALRRAMGRRVDEERGKAERLPDVSLAIGPEGGWEREELALLTSGGWTPVSLGPRILRAETAAIAAIAIIASLIDLMD